MSGSHEREQPKNAAKITLGQCPMSIPVRPLACPEEGVVPCLVVGRLWLPNFVAGDQGDLVGGLEDRVAGLGVVGQWVALVALWGLVTQGGNEDRGEFVHAGPVSLAGVHKRQGNLQQKKMKLILRIPLLPSVIFDTFFV